MQLTFVHLNMIFRFFAEQGLIPDNPVGPIKKPPAARRSPKWLSRNEQNAFLREVRGLNSKRDYAIVLLMLRAGLRVHELCDLLKSEVTISARAGSVYVRGTFGHDLISAGNDLQQVAMLMGHYKKDGTPNIQMTMIYTTPGMEDLAAAVESISWI
ncbi:tyrosine-type recombinase/integrase [Paenibacillus provencensis]|uniref:Tyrosine-type recombinase/integrase n=1 Tax=Paenibacillus provencensis TaxID=441151 RepID=A0ABW3Q0M2_9BACL